PAFFLAKRVIDLMLSSLLLTVVLPVMLVIAAAIKFDSPGPVLFVQERVGSRRRAGSGGSSWQPRPFRLLKFRSMVVDADPSLHRAPTAAFVAGQLNAGADSRARFKLAADPRVTRVGRLIRRTSLDELPQLVNVLKGEMSLVGPRPVPGYEVAGYRTTDYERLGAKPGITGLWQVKGRCQLSFEEMVELDRSYAHSQSLLLDLKILAVTLPAVLSGRGAG